MKFSRNLEKYCVQKNIKLVDAMEFMSNRKTASIFVLDGKKLIGSLTDGDIRRSIVSKGEAVLSSSVMASLNKEYFFLGSNEKPEKSMFSNGVKAIPLVDDKSTILGVYLNEPPSFSLGGHIISSETPPFIIAEIGINHQGCIKTAKSLVKAAYDSGADCAKFQMRDMNSLYSKAGQDDPSGDLGTQYTLGILEKFSLTNEEMIEAFDYCKELGLVPLCTPWDTASLQVLENYGMQGYKVASADFTNLPFIKELCATGKPLILSTGMSTQSEITTTLELLDDSNANYALLHCNSTYPAPFKDVNLAYMDTLRQLAGEKAIIGYSGHERGWFIPCAAVAKGACVIEKHFTFDKKQEGNDHKVSLLPDEFKTMVSALKSTYESIGSGHARVLSQGEMINRQTLSKSIVAKRDLNSGHRIQEDDLTTQSPGNGLQPARINELIGQILHRNVKAREPFFEGDLIPLQIIKKRYSFQRPYGVPVRYHDYKKLSAKTKLDFVEFHMSWRDLKLDISDFVDKTYDLNFAVHAPDLFENDLIMDLGHNDAKVRADSVSALQEVVDVTNTLKNYFPQTKSPVVVANLGGWSKDRFLSDGERIEMLSRLKSELAKVKTKGVTLAVQTMPPFPWHFGGQGFCNFFTLARDVVNFCEDTGHRVCLDVSHTLMSANHFGFDISHFLKLIGKYVVHIHISDAEGVDGEGVEFGAGDLDLSNLAPDLERYCPNVQFLPEIWQGHNNEGYGFWNALNYLDGKL